MTEISVHTRMRDMLLMLRDGLATEADARSLLDELETRLWSAQGSAAAENAPEGSAPFLEVMQRAMRLYGESIECMREWLRTRETATATHALEAMDEAENLLYGLHGHASMLVEDAMDAREEEA